ncbi:hypothetical protein FB459_1938 [Yimella lutea]|uniref:Uncharacterized protein n=1 Tax=Yimella lutea TaxID=587872 RepID=A0A542EGN9_9MICO|nr:hypothetical protein [Yimella lutea]TQJ14474.1 hypothetical protein FB459_1938 [Yimella lutea]
MGLLVRALIVDAASAAPIAYAIVCGLLGSEQSLWSIPLAPPSGDVAMVAAILLPVAGLTAGSGRHPYLAASTCRPTGDGD